MGNLKKMENVRHTNITFRCNRNCNYCYAKGLFKKFPNDMSLVTFKKLIEWYFKQKIKIITLIGGEPTLHSNFSQTIQHLKKNDFKISILTNGIFSKNVLNMLDPDVILGYQINCNPPEYYATNQMNILKTNLNYLKNYDWNVVLRYNINDVNQNYEYIFDLLDNYDIKQLCFSPTFPNINKTNIFIDTKVDYASYLINLVNKCIEQGIEPRIDEPIPFCIFETSDRNYLKKHAKLLGACRPGQNMYAVNPDLSVFPCLPFIINAPKIINFENEDELLKYFSNMINYIKWKVTTFDKCSECKYFIRKQCQGGCLMHKFILKRTNIKTIYSLLKF